MQIATRSRRWPGLLAAILICLSPAVVAADDSALYWALSRGGEAAGFLLGTIHSEDPRVLDFPQEFVGQLAGNRFFAMEMVPDLPTLNRLTEYMYYQDGTTLEDRIGTERFTRVRSALAPYGVPSDWIARMKVWAAMMTLSVPPPESGLFMDFSLSLRAAGAGLKVVGLETLDQQLSFLEEMPLPQQIELLDQALDDYDGVAEVHARMVESYLAGDVLALKELSDEQMAQLEPAAQSYFTEQGINARNRRMLESALPYLSQGKVFIAVGALHLPGPAGLVELLRGAGYELSPLPLPLSASQNGKQAENDSQGQAGEAP